MGWFHSSLRSLCSRSPRSRRAARRNRTWILEELEGRRLLSLAVEAIANLPNATSPIIAGSDGDLWVAVNPTPSTAAIDRIGLNGSVTSFPVPENALPGGFSIASLSTGPDGNVWFDANDDLSYSDNQVLVGYVAPAGQVTELPPIPLSAGQVALADYNAMVSGPGGDLWFGYSVSNSAQEWQNFIGRVTTAGQITSFPISSFGKKSPFLVYSLAVGADGNLWFTEGVGKPFVLGRMSPSGVVTRLPFHQVIIGRVEDGADGSFVLTGQNSTFEQEVFHATTAGAVTRDRIPAAISGAFNTYLGAADGSLWFTNEFGNVTGAITIGRMTEQGVATSYNLSHVVHNSTADLDSMAIGQDGNLYVLDTFQAKGGLFVARVYRLSPSRFR